VCHTKDDWKCFTMETGGHIAVIISPTMMPEYFVINSASGKYSLKLCHTIPVAFCGAKFQKRMRIFVASILSFGTSLANFLTRGFALDPRAGALFPDPCYKIVSLYCAY